MLTSIKVLHFESVGYKRVSKIAKLSTAKIAAFSTERNLTFGENSFVNSDLKVYFEQIDEKMGNGKVFMMTPSNFVPGMDFYLNPVYKNSTSLRVTTLQLTTEEGFWDGKTGLATNSIFFCFLFMKKTLICLEGKSIAWRANQ